MKRKTGVILAAVLMIQIMAASAVFAADDVNVNATLFPEAIKPSKSTGNLTYNLQEGAHQTVTKHTGKSIEHSYIYITLNGTTILAVDPPAAMY